MAIRTGIIGWEAEVTDSRQRASTLLAALPAGTLAGIYEDRVEAVGTAVQIAVDSGPESVWLATGAHAAATIRWAQSKRPLVQRIVGAMGDEAALGNGIVAQAESGKTVVVVKGDRNDAGLARLAEAQHVIQFGRWTTKVVR